MFKLGKKLKLKMVLMINTNGDKIDSGKNKLHLIYIQWYI